MHLLNGRSPLTITEISGALDMSHPSLIEVTADMIEHGLLVSAKCKNDRRKRELSLTAKGRRTCVKLQPVWRAFKEIGDDLNTEPDNDFLKSITKFEKAINRASAYDRVMAKLGKKLTDINETI